MVSQIICCADNINLIFLHLIFGEPLLHTPTNEISSILRYSIEDLYQRQYLFIRLLALRRQAFDGMY